MYLQRRQNLLSPNFRLVSVDKYNKEEEITLDAMNHFYQGVLEGECTVVKQLLPGHARGLLHSS